jgi:hypothetical protein
MTQGNQNTRAIASARRRNDTKHPNQILSAVTDSKLTNWTDWAKSDYSTAELSLEIRKPMNNACASDNANGEWRRLCGVDCPIFPTASLAMRYSHFWLTYQNDHLPVILLIGEYKHDPSSQTEQESNRQVIMPITNYPYKIKKAIIKAKSPTASAKANPRIA